jgi:hypothetical protein
MGNSLEQPGSQVTFHMPVVFYEFFHGHAVTSDDIPVTMNGMEESYSGNEFVIDLESRYRFTDKDIAELNALDGKRISVNMASDKTFTIYLID